MLKILRNKMGAAHFVEYAMLVFTVVAAISAMSLYMKRGINARWRDTHRHMVNSVFTEIAPYYDNYKIYYWYEPYYVNSQVVMDKALESSQVLGAGGQTGSFREVYNDNITTRTVSETAPPKDAD